MNEKHCKPAELWHPRADGRVQCVLCPRGCVLNDGQAGWCATRLCQGGTLITANYGQPQGLCLDPIEKKPLYHFLPGTAVLSFGTLGCNLACRFCQNWHLSKARDLSAGPFVSPAALARLAVQYGAHSLAYTYNDPAVFLEYASDTAAAARALGIRNVAVTAGYLSAAARVRLFADMDAANVDVKAFSEAFYRRYCGGHLGPVLETLVYLKHETTVWLELTTLLIPGLNDSDAELDRLCTWISAHLGVDVPLHFTAFHPAYRLLDLPPTPLATLRRARQRARASGLHYVYTGNLRDPDGTTTYCSSCGTRLIERDGYRLGAWRLDAAGRCMRCATPCAGVFLAQPGHWGERRVALSAA